MLLLAAVSLLQPRSARAADSHSMSLQNPAAQNPAPAAPSAISAEERGDLLVARQQYLAAIEAYREAPESAVVLNKMGIAYHHLFALDEARRDYQRALLIRPNYAEAINNLGAADFAQGHYKQSIRLYRRAMKLMPHSAVIAANLGTAYFARGKYRNGLEAYQTAFSLDAHVFDADPLQLIEGASADRDRARQDYCIAELYAESGDRVRALEYLRRALNDGFRDRNLLMQDSSLAQLRRTPEFAQLMAEEKMH